MDPFILIVLVVGLGGLLLLNWRTRKKQQEQLSFRDRLVVGQRVQTVGGVIGTVTAFEGDYVTIESTPGTEIVFLRKALAALVDDLAGPDSDEDYPEDTESDPADAETTIDPGEETEQGSAAVVRSPEVPEGTRSGASPDSGEDDTPRSTQN